MPTFERTCLVYTPAFNVGMKGWYLGQTPLPQAKACAAVSHCSCLNTCIHTHTSKIKRLGKVNAHIHMNATPQPHAPRTPTHTQIRATSFHWNKRCLSAKVPVRRTVHTFSPWQSLRSWWPVSCFLLTCHVIATTSTLPQQFYTAVYFGLANRKIETACLALGNRPAAPGENPRKLWSCARQLLDQSSSSQWVLMVTSEVA